MRVSETKDGIRPGTAVGVFLIIFAIISIVSGMEYERSISDEQAVLPGRVYSLSFYSAANMDVSVSYNLSKGGMTVLITNPGGHSEVLESGYPSEENLLFVLTETSNGSAIWTSSIEGRYYVIFIMFSAEGASIDVSVTYTGSVPELMHLGIILIILGTAMALMDLLVRSVRLKKGEPKA